MNKEPASELRDRIAYLMAKGSTRYDPDDTELVMSEIAAKGNFNEDGGEMGNDDWPVA